MDTLRNVPQYIPWHIRIFLSQFVAIRCAYGPKFRQNFTCIYCFFQFFLILWRCKIFLKLWSEYQLCFTKSQVFLTTCKCWFSCNTALNFLGMAAKSAIGRYLDIVEFSNWRFYRPLDGVYCSTNCSRHLTSEAAENCPKGFPITQNMDFDPRTMSLACSEAELLPKWNFHFLKSSLTPYSPSIPFLTVRWIWGFWKWFLMIPNHPKHGVWHQNHVSSTFRS